MDTEEDAYIVNVEVLLSMNYSVRNEVYKTVGHLNPADMSQHIK